MAKPDDEMVYHDGDTFNFTQEGLGGVALVRAVIEAYKDRYGRKPDRVWVNPCSQAPNCVCGVQVFETPIVVECCGTAGMYDPHRDYSEFL